MRRFVLIRIQTDVDVPIYQQIIDQVKAQVADGTVKKGDRLPPVRELSREIGVNVNTVYKAYRELESQGVVRMRVGFGVTVIAQRRNDLRDSERERIMQELVDRLRVEAYHLGFDEQYVIGLLRKCVRPGEDDT
jgi:GntR family transcriptional regulator